MRAGNNSVVLKNSTEHAEPLFIALSYDLDFLVRLIDLMQKKTSYNWEMSWLTVSSQIVKTLSLCYKVLFF